MTNVGVSFVYLSETDPEFICTAVVSNMEGEELAETVLCSEVSGAEMDLDAQSFEAWHCARQEETYEPEQEFEYEPEDYEWVPSF